MKKDAILTPLETVSTLTVLDVGIDLAICFVTLQTSSHLKNLLFLGIDLLPKVHLVYVTHLELGDSFNCV